MSTEVKQLVSRAITHLLDGNKNTFKKLAYKAEYTHLRDKHLYVTIQDIMQSKRCIGGKA